MALAREYGPEAIKKLAHLMREGDNEQTQRAACSELLDRAYGKATQQTDSQTIVEIPIFFLRTYTARFYMVRFDEVAGPPVW